MSFVEWADLQSRKLGWLDWGFVKVASGAFALLLAKLWPPLLGLDWYWYALVFGAVALKPAWTVLRK